MLSNVNYLYTESQFGTSNSGIEPHLKQFYDPETGLQALQTLLLFLLLLVLRLFLAFFISQPIIVKLRIHIADNVLQNRTVSNFQVKS